MKNEKHEICRAVGTILAAFTATGLLADTLTWKGGTSGDFSAAANWTSAATGNDAAPQPGDTLKVTSSTTFTDGAFNIGSAGITIENSAELTNNVAFSGSGRLVKGGSGRWYQCAACTHSGGTEVTAGVLKPIFDNAVDFMGPGDIYLSGSGILETMFQTFTKKIWISGNKREAIKSTNNTFIYSPVESTCDISVKSAWGLCRFFGGIQASGHEVEFTSNGSGRDFVIRGAVEADKVYKKTANVMTFEGDGRVVSPLFAVEDGLVVIGATNGVYSVASSPVTSIPALASATTIVKGTGKIRSNVAGAIVYSLAVGEDEPLPSGRYSATNLPGALDAGSEEIQVYPAPAVAYWQGGAAGAWSLGSNWSTAVAPRDGAVAVFTNSTDLACEAFDFGAGGIMLVNASPSSILKQWTMFAGSGTYRKCGSGLVFYNSESSYTGGTVLMDGEARLNFMYTNLVFGAKTGTVVLKPFSGRNLPMVNCTVWSVDLPYHFEIQGALADPSSDASFRTQNNLHLTAEASLTSDSDFNMHTAWGPITLRCPVSAPGRTITFSGDYSTYQSGAPHVSILTNTVDASIVKKGTHYLRLDAVSPGEDNRLAVDGGLLTLNVDAAWGGTNVTVASGAQLALTGSQNLSEDATLSIAAGGTLDLTNDVVVCVRRLVTGGVRQGPGWYYASNLGDYITGTGRLKVGKGIGFSVFVR